MRRIETEASPHFRDLLATLVRRLPTWRRSGAAGTALAATLSQTQPRRAAPSSEALMALVESFCQWPHRRVGTPEGRAAEEWLSRRFGELGIEDVRVEPIPVDVWRASDWSLAVDGVEVPSFFVVNTGHTSEAGITGVLAYVGCGSEVEFRKLDVRGKIVVAEVPFRFVPTGLLLRALRRFGALYGVTDEEELLRWTAGQVLPFVRRNFIGGTTLEDAPDHDVYWRAVRHGAAGLCLILRDQPAGTNSHYGPYDGIMKPLPALWIGKHDGAELRDEAKAGRVATLRLMGTVEPGASSNIWGILPGRSDDIVMLTSHHDAPFQGAVEDGTGVAQVLSQVGYWSATPAQDRPCTLLFVLSTGHFYGSIGAHTFASEHADLMRRVRLMLTLEHLGAKEVRELGRGYEETGRAALSVLFTSAEPETVALACHALRHAPPPMAAAIPSTLLAPAPTSDAAGYVLESGVPVISWIGCPYYLLDEHDTLDKVDPSALAQSAKTVTLLVQTAMDLHTRRAP